MLVPGEAIANVMQAGQECFMAQADSSLDATIRRAAQLLLAAEYVTALTGAGISVESGIPPFRGPGGLWTKYGEPPMDGYQRFLQDPKKAWEERLAPTGTSQEIRETIARATPNPGHTAFVKLEEMGVLHWLITQNVDNLHRRAGSRHVLEIHGNSTLEEFPQYDIYLPSCGLGPCNGSPSCILRHAGCGLANPASISATSGM